MYFIDIGAIIYDLTSIIFKWEIRRNITTFDKSFSVLVQRTGKVTSFKMGKIKVCQQKVYILNYFFFHTK